MVVIELLNFDDAHNMLHNASETASIYLRVSTQLSGFRETRPL